MTDAVGIVTTAVELALKIKEAVDTVRQNREDCVHIKRRVERVRHTLSLCEGNPELMESPAVRNAVEALAEVLGDALELVTGCQEETRAVCLCYSAGKLSKQLSKVDRGITDGNCEATFAILVYHISKQTGDGAGPAMPTETEEIQEPSVVDETPEQTPQFWYAELSLVPSEVRTPSEGSAHGGGGPSEGEEDDYGDDGGLLQEIARVTLAIRTAVETVRRNKDECVQIDKIASRVSLTLPQLEHTETTKDTVVRRVFKRLLKTFRRAHELVVACQRRSIVVLCSHGKPSNDLHWVLDYLMRDINILIDVLSGDY